MVKDEHGLTDVSFNTWIKPLEVFAIDGNTLYILVPSEQMGLSYINKKYYLPLKVAIGEVTGVEYDIQFILPDQAQSLKFKNNDTTQLEPQAPVKGDHSNLNPNYTFDTFVVGNNQVCPLCFPCSGRKPGRSIQSAIYIWWSWTWQDSPYAFNRSFHH